MPIKSGSLKSFSSLASFRGGIVAALLGCLLAFVVGSYGQQRQETPAELNLRSLSYKFAAAQIDIKLLTDENAALRQELTTVKSENAALKKELAEAKQESKSK